MSVPPETVAKIAMKSMSTRRAKRSSPAPGDWFRASDLKGASRWWKSPAAGSAALFWAIIYVLFTIRSFGLGRPFILEQAFLRVPMMAVGILLTGAIFGIVRWVADLKQLERLSMIGAAIFGAAVLYGCVNYLVFYVLPRTWTTPQGPAGKIEEYVVGMIPIFTLCSIGIAFFEGRRRMAAKRSYAREIWANVHGGKIRIAVSDIRWIHAERDYVRVLGPQGAYLIRGTMRQMERQLDPEQFVRVHRSAIVPRASISSVERLADGRLAIRLDKDTVVPIGRNFIGQILGDHRGSSRPRA